MKYDDYEYYFLNFENEDLPQKMGATHIGMFMAWAILNDLAAKSDDSEYAVWLERVRQRKITGRDFLLQWCDGKLCSEDLNEAGNAFAKAFYEESYMGYYCQTFNLEAAESADELCSVEDTWDNFDKLASVLDKYFQSKT